MIPVRTGTSTNGGRRRARAFASRRRKWREMFFGVSRIRSPYCNIRRVRRRTNANGVL